MRRARHLFAGLPVVALIVGASLPVQAQDAPSGQAQGLRYLSWNGRPTAPQSAPASAPADVRRDLRRPNRVIPHGGSAEALATPRAGLTPAPGGNRVALTPASTWLAGSPAPAAEAAPQPLPPPATARPAAPQPAQRPAIPAPQPQSPVNALPDYVPAPDGGQPVPAGIVSGDPIAPRRDAPIFRMQQTAPDDAQTPASPSPRAGPRERPQADSGARTREVALVQGNPHDRPASQGARYYSVHRQNGQAPDAVVLPQPTYIDALTITNLPETPATQDLAQPAEPPAMIRDAQGRVRIQPAAPEGDYQ